jgi:hypothetical protein
MVALALSSRRKLYACDFFLSRTPHRTTVSEEITEEFLLFAIKSGLLKQWANGFGTRLERIRSGAQCLRHSLL